MSGTRTLAWCLFVAVSSCVPQPGSSNLGIARAPGAPGTAREDAPSLFAEPWIWNDENGAAVRFEQWRGTPIIVSMLFTSCTTTCPLTVEKLRRADETLRRERSPATFVLVTLDPQNDTPAQLREFKASRQLPQEWHLVRGSYEQTRALADLLRIHVLEDGHIFHDSRIVVFDRDGNLLGQLRG